MAKRWEGSRTMPKVNPLSDLFLQISALDNIRFGIPTTMMKPMQTTLTASIKIRIKALNSIRIKAADSIRTMEEDSINT